MKLQLLFLLLAFNFTLKAQLKELPPKIATTDYGKSLERSMHLLSDVSREKRAPIKILFYGQSIIAVPYIKEFVEADLRNRFPEADITIIHDAIGGYQAEKLVKTAQHMIYPRYPDLIIFHCYGGEWGPFEQIIKDIQGKTTAEILSWTHHIDNLSAEVDKDREVGVKLRRDLADKYNFEIAEVREQWKKYLEMHNLEKSDLLLSDQIHIKEEGGHLIGALLNRHLNGGISNPTNWSNKVKTITGSEILSENGFLEGNWAVEQTTLVNNGGTANLKYKFYGNRIDIGTITNSTSFGTANILIDGKKPSTHVDNWAITLPSKLQGYNRPGIMKVDLHGGQPLAEKWTVTILEVSPDGKEFKYSVKGSASGFQGNGDHRKEFVSNNGIISFKPENFSLNHAYQLKALPRVPFDITWEVYNTSVDIWQPKAKRDGYEINRTTIAKGLINGEHVLEIIPNGDGALPITEFVVHRPLLARESVTTAPNIKLKEPIVINAEDVELNVEIEDPERKINKVIYYHGATKIGESTSFPYTITWENISQGNYPLKAIATYGDYNFNVSNVVNFNIGSGTQLSKKFILEAEGWYESVDDKGENDIAIIAAAQKSNGRIVSIFDYGDKLKIPFNIANDLPAQIKLKVRSRSGDSSSKESFWPDGYVFSLNGKPLTFSPDPASISAFTQYLGGSYWGTFISEDITITNNNQILEIISNKDWGAIDYIELEVKNAAENTMVFGIAGLVQNYDGKPKSVSVKTLPENMPVTVTYNQQIEAPTEPGNYQVRIAAQLANSSNETNATLKILGANAITDQAFSSKIQVYPNPVRGSFILEDLTRDPSPAELQLFNSTGILVNEYKKGRGINKLTIEMANEHAGLYFLVYRKEGKIGIKKIQKL